MAWLIVSQVECVILSGLGADAFFKGSHIHGINLRKYLLAQNKMSVAQYRSIYSRYSVERYLLSVINRRDVFNHTMVKTDPILGLNGHYSLQV